MLKNQIRFTFNDRDETHTQKENINKIILMSITQNNNTIWDKRNIINQIYFQLAKNFAAQDCTEYHSAAGNNIITSNTIYFMLLSSFKLIIGSHREGHYHKDNHWYPWISH